MEAFDLGLRLFIFGQHAIIIAAVLLAVRNQCAAWLVGLCIALQFYVLISSPTLESYITDIRLFAALVATSIPWIFWFFVRHIFELPRQKLWVPLSWIVLVLPKWLVLAAIPDAFPELQSAMLIAKQLAGIAIVLHALFSVVTTYNDDLLESRRLFRLVLVAAVGLMILSVMLVELFVDFKMVETQLSLLASASIAFISLLLGPYVIVHCRELLDHSSPVEPALPKDESSLSSVSSAHSAKEVANKQLIDALKAHMLSGAYRQSGLTIGDVAAELGVPEHLLRKLINNDLGYRNFSAFLQAYRIEFVCEQLLDPAKARIPILTLALDAGFGSLGPFNRAFKALKGVTPTHYRSNLPVISEKS